MQDWRLTKKNKS